MFKLVVFDLDGTLVDSRRDIADAANALLVEEGARPLDEASVGRMVGDGAAMLVARAFQAAGLPQPPDALRRWLALYEPRQLLYTRPYPAIPRVLQTLAGRASLAVLTNKPLEPTRQILAGLDLETYFPRDLVVGGDGPLGRKPDPRGLRQLVDAVGVSPAEAVLVGDSVIDWGTARKAGVQICLARYGFGFETFPTDQLAGTELFADQAIDLLHLLY